MIADKQKEYREKVLADIEKKAEERKLKAREKREVNRESDMLKHLEKVKEFQKLHPGKPLTKRFMLVNGEYEKVEICNLQENNIIVKENKITEEKWNRINEWKGKMAKAGIKTKPRKYHKPPRDLSIHTHDKCRVPTLTKRNKHPKW